jgi:periplasmic divalent cation tolerance protein
MMKTIPENIQSLEKLIKENHPYDVPEIIFLPIISGSTEYLDWVVKNSTNPEK